MEQCLNNYPYATKRSTKTFLPKTTRGMQRASEVVTQNFVFVLLAYWVNWALLQCKVQMEHREGSVLDINGTFADLGQKCLQLLGMHASVVVIQRPTLTAKEGSVH